MSRIDDEDEDQYDALDGNEVDTGKRSRNWVFTINNWTAAIYDAVTALDCRYLVVGKEVGKKGTPHLQGYISFKNDMSRKKVGECLPKSWFQVAKGTPKQASAYCEKDKDFFTKGIRPASKDEKGQRGGDAMKRKWDDLVACVEKGDYDAIDNDMAPQVKCVEYLVKKRKAQNADLSRLIGDRGTQHEWHYGEPHSGKSFYCDSRPGLTFSKPCGVWFDQYEFEPNLHFEDVDVSSAYDGRVFKQLMDVTPFMASVKGTMQKIRPRNVYISSNEHPNKIFKGIDLRAILDRCKLVYWGKDFRDPDWVHPVTGQTKADLETPPPIPDV
jgi:hypothetical protein